MITRDILDRLVTFDTVSAHSKLPLVAYVEDLLNAHDFRVSWPPSRCGNKAGLYAEIGPEVYRVGHQADVQV
ncbi:MAG: hypothetical protein ABJL99_14180 [Aliishimia sp.]